jgi:SdrD B-like domain
MRGRVLVLTLTISCCILSPLYANAQITGTVFRDGNGNGVLDAGETGIPAITVNAYNTAGTLCGSAVSNGNISNNYTITGTCSGPIRVEFVIPTSGVSCQLSNTVDFSTVAGTGTGSGTSVQFVTYPASNVNFGVMSSDYYVANTNPTMFVPCYVNGADVQGTSVGNMDVFVSFAYNSSGVPMMSGGSAPNPTHLTSMYQTGSCWGVAYSKQAKRVFLSAFMKRHVGMGPNGPGAIYMIDPANPPGAGVIPSFVRLDVDLGFPVQATGSYVATHPGFNGVIGSNTDRALPTGLGDPSRDKSAFDQIGKVSLGDLDISDDGRYLFTINLWDRKVYRLDLQNPNSPVVPTTAQTKAYNAAPWLTTSCTNNGVARPFALKFYRGKLYVGVVCTGENGIASPLGQRDANDLRAFVYEMDPAGTGAASIVLEFPLNYNKEGMASGDKTTRSGWYRWTDTWANILSYNFAFDCDNDPFGGGALPGHPQPMLVDIEFDVDGSMILSFADRTSHQTGAVNYSPVDGDNIGYSSILGGDILRAWKNPTTCSFELERDGTAGPLTSTAPDQSAIITGLQAMCLFSTSTLAQATCFSNYYGTGPGTPVGGTGAAHTGYSGRGKEFYWGDGAVIFCGRSAQTPHHNETNMGGLGFLPSSGEVLTVILDPVDGIAWSSGVAKLSNTTGAKVGGYNLVTGNDPITAAANGQFGKAAGLGDVEITAEIPPIEIGNRVWLDANKNGIQDPGESPISNVSIQLYAADGTTLLGSTTTNSNGLWYFNIANVTDGNVALVGNQAGPQPNTTYIVRVGNADWSGGVGTGDLLNMALTTANTGGSGQPDVRDSDATLIANVPEISVTTAAEGQNNHTLDMGFSMVCTINNLTATPGTCVRTTNQYTLTGAVTFTDAPATGTLTVQLSSGQSQVFNAPFTSPINYSITGIPSDGLTRTATATFSADPTCTRTVSYGAPSYCFCLNNNCVPTTVMKN